MKMPKVSSKLTSTTCDVCFASLARRADLARHMRLHDDEKSRMMYRCPFEGCEFANLQKCNVDTHIRVHRGVKDKHCPECEFRTGDPGSLTRHRKRMHGYEPKARRARLGGAAAAKRANRSSPYPSTSPRSPATSESGESEASGSSSGSSATSASSSSPSSAPSPWYTISESEPSSPSDSTTPETPVNMTLIDDLSSLGLSALEPYQTYSPVCSPLEFCSNMDGQTFGCSSVTAADNFLFTYPWQKDPYTSTTSDMELGISLFSQPQQLDAETDLASLSLTYPPIDDSVSLTDMPFTLTGFEAAPDSYYLTPESVIPAAETMAMEPFADWSFNAIYSPVSLPKVEAQVAALPWDSFVDISSACTMPVMAFESTDSEEEEPVAIPDTLETCSGDISNVVVDWDDLFGAAVTTPSTLSTPQSGTYATHSDEEFDSLFPALVHPSSHSSWSF